MIKKKKILTAEEAKKANGGYYVEFDNFDDICFETICFCKIDQNKCNNCGKCKSVCPVNAIHYSIETGHYKINEGICDYSWKCLLVCPCDAIERVETDNDSDLY